MRRLFAMFAAFALVIALVPAVANADTSGGCFGASQCRFAGLSVDASWSGIPASGPVVGEEYTDSYVAASTSMTSSKGTKTASGGLWFQQFSYIYDGSEKPTPTGETFVTDFGPDLVVTVDRKLRTASASGTVMVVTCTIAPDYSETCGEPIATLVRGTWTATGAALEVVSTYRAKGGGSTYNEKFAGTQRDATATVSIGGRAVPGIVNWASISNSSGHTVSICHVPAC